MKLKIKTYLSIINLKKGFVYITCLSIFKVRITYENWAITRYYLLVEKKYVCPTFS